MSTLIHRDPYARGAYRRFSLPQKKAAEHLRYSCRWCGQKPDRLYNYVWESDSKPRQEYPVGSWFCNFKCYTSYGW